MSTLGADGRLLVGTAGVVGTALVARQPQVGLVEARVFHAVNRLPDGLYRPGWVVMQCGALGAAPVTAGLALLAHERTLAVRTLVGGTAAWGLAKLVKGAIRRPRPARLLDGTQIRGRQATGLGYLSGHAAVSTALAAALADRGPVAALAGLGVVAVVGSARIYVGAHLPLDVAGGVFLGLAVDGALRRTLTRPALRA